MGNMSEKYTLEWWKEWRDIADGIRWNAERMIEASDEAIALSKEHGWKETGAGASFLCMLFQLKDTMEEVWSEVASLEKEFPQYWDAVHYRDDDEEEE